ncbi:MAG: hypothetical protein M3137_17660, partial [Actinomycetota bacterium]|nr:hypothetical protein [Actinomycetota bacterium]
MTVRRRLLIGLLAILAVLIAAVGVAEILVLRHALYQRSAQGLRSDLAVLASAPPPPPSSTATVDTTTGVCASPGSTLPPGPPGPGSRGRGRGDKTMGPDGAIAVARALAAQSIASAITGPDGTVVTCATARRKGHQASFAVPASLTTALSATTGYVTLHTQAHHLLAVSQPLGPDQA